MTLPCHFHNPLQNIQAHNPRIPKHSLHTLIPHAKNIHVLIRAPKDPAFPRTPSLSFSSAIHKVHIKAHVQIRHAQQRRLIRATPDSFTSRLVCVEEGRGGGEPEDGGRVVGDALGELGAGEVGTVGQEFAGERDGGG